MYFGMMTMGEDVQSHCHLFPEGRTPIFPNAGLVGIQKWPVLINDVRAPARGGLAKELGEVLLGACGPSSQIGAQPSDEFSQHLERAIGFLKGGPIPW